MMKRKTTKTIINGVVLAAVAALGITVYQLGTSPVKENEEIQELPLENIQQEYSTETEQPPMVDAGTSRVEAGLEDAAPAPEEPQTKETDGQATASFGAENTEPGEEAANTSAVIGVPELNFSEDTLMEWPVNGNILVDYSMDQTTYFATLDQYKLSPAIAVQAVEEAPVLAAAQGEVFSVTHDARTGTTVTMELGNGYQAIYGQLKDLAVSEGDVVGEGDLIGYISEPTKYYSREGSNLYFAMKKDGEPIDPIAYLP